MKIRRGTQSDIPDVLRMVDAWHKEHPQKIGFRVNSLTILEMGKACIEHPNMVGLVATDGEDSTVGFIVGAIWPAPLDHTQRIGQVAMWYVTPQWRGSSAAVRLQHEFERWAFEQGCEFVAGANMTGHDDERIEKLYRRLGYEPLETHWIRRIAKPKGEEDGS